MKKIRSFTEKYAILAAFIVFLVIEVVLFVCGKLLKLLPATLPMAILGEIITILIPMGFVCFFGFSSAFRKGSFFRGLTCALPFLLVELFSLTSLFAVNLANPEANWQSVPRILFDVFAVIGIGIREECLYRATIQNIVAKKYANSVKGIWITVLIGSLLFGLCHVPNIIYGMNPLSMISQVTTAFFYGLMLGAVYLRSGNLWVIALIHALTDTVSLFRSVFLDSSDMEVANTLSFSWDSLLLSLGFLALAVFLLRPSKCKQICQSLCFAEVSKDEAAKV